MWTRGELKARAKEKLRAFYWYGVAVCFVAGLLGGNANGGINVNFGASTSSIRYQMSNLFANADRDIVIAIVFLMIAIFVVVFLISLIFTSFVSNPLCVGRLSFFIKSAKKGKSTGMDELFHAFGCGHYLNVVKTMFFKGLFQFLWSLLLFIPGIIKSYEYYMMPYLMAEYPDMDTKEAFRLSKQMMQGEKFKTWVLELSFLGWYLLGLLACCIGGIFVNPYRDATFTELYFELKKKAFAPEPEAQMNADQTNQQYYNNHGQQ